jgi:hypothetical protein
VGGGGGGGAGDARRLLLRGARGARVIRALEMTELVLEGAGLDSGTGLAGVRCGTSGEGGVWFARLPVVAAANTVVVPPETIVEGAHVVYRGFDV